MRLFFVLLAVAVCGAERVLSKRTLQGVGRWSNTSSWEGNRIPRAEDDVFIDTVAVCSRGENAVQFIIDVTTARVRSLTIQSTFFCPMLVEVETEAVLSADVVYIGAEPSSGWTRGSVDPIDRKKHATLLLAPKSTVIAENVTVRNLGVLMGYGKVNSTAFFAASGSHLAPGISLAGSCIECYPGRGNQNFYGGLTIAGDAQVKGAELWLKFATANIKGGFTYDTLTFSDVQWNSAKIRPVYSNAAQLDIRAPVILWTTSTGTLTITYENVVNPVAYPWVSACWSSDVQMCIVGSCGGPGGGADNGARRAVAGRCPGESLNNPSIPSGGGDDELCLSDNSGISVLLQTQCSTGPANCENGYVGTFPDCVPFCDVAPKCNQHGTCQTYAAPRLPRCVCNALVDGFGWIGERCDTPVCSADCSGTHGACQGSEPMPICQCTAQWTGPSCATPVCDENCNAPNGTCVGTTGTPTCQCQPGFAPPTCADRTCPACQNGGTCNTQTGLCECPGIFYGSQCQLFTCPGFDADTSTPNCNGNGWCNASTSYSCDCFPDWGGSDCATPTCADTLQSCSSPNGTCVFNNDQLQCDCETGFSRPICTPQCPVCLNGGTCDVPTGTCQCTGIFYGSDCSQYTCPGYDAQQGVPNCNGRGVCNAGTGYACECVDNWSGTACETPSCTDTLDGCNAPNGTCIAKGNTAECSCQSTNAGLRCETELVINQCPTCTNGGTCEAPNTTCSCPENYSGALCEQFTCLVHPTCNGHGSCTASNLACNCDDNWGGDACQTPTCADTLDSCHGPTNGTCVVTAGSPQCSCSAGFSPPTCLVSCPSCFNGGTCSPGSGVCSCVNGFYGSQCQLFDCNGHPNCNGRGSCTASNRTCSCNANWGGAACQTPTCADTFQSCNAPSGGACVAPSGTPECNCNSGFEGATCTPECPTCLNGGSCNTTTFKCSCPAPFFGTDCALFSCPGFVAGVSENCNGQGTCDASTGYQCLCVAQYSGSDDCSVRACPSTHCKNGGTCRLPPSASLPLTCQCVDGWLGATCDSNRTCPSGYCANGGTCVQISGTELACDCASGFAGPQCRSSQAGGVEPYVYAVVVVAIVVFGVGLAVTIFFVHRWRTSRRTLEMNQRIKNDEFANNIPLSPNPMNQ